jgi:hypothetical protein
MRRFLRAIECLPLGVLLIATVIVGGPPFAIADSKCDAVAPPPCKQCSATCVGNQFAQCLPGITGIVIVSPGPPPQTEKRCTLEPKCSCLK